MGKDGFSTKKIRNVATKKLSSGMSNKQVAKFLCQTYDGFKEHRKEIVNYINTFNPLLAFETERRIKKLNHKDKSDH